jgi:hypothetical protein
MMPENNSQKVQLGCGTLILIALIVMFFSSGHRGTSDLENKVEQLTTEIQRLKTAIEDQTREIQSLRRQKPPLAEQPDGQH